MKEHEFNRYDIHGIPDWVVATAIIVTWIGLSLAVAAVLISVS